jgi:hypothetical protein
VLVIGKNQLSDYIYPAKHIYYYKREISLLKSDVWEISVFVTEMEPEMSSTGCKAH